MAAVPQPLSEVVDAEVLGPEVLRDYEYPHGWRRRGLDSLLDHQQALLRRPVELLDLGATAGEKARYRRGAGISGREPEHLRRRPVQKRVLPEIVVPGYDDLTLVARVRPDGRIRGAAHSQAFRVGTAREVCRE